ncbi:MAG TPA: ATP-binding cassette domain-containing protein [Micropruina sp.]|nr:ATP-binding cassette domain-containing protein [Micropruina sp.]HMR20999.1 ATP-binding cassette domain-containing protein [Micropruina sp.]
MIRFDSVGKSYPDGTEAVRDFTLELPSGRTTVLVGSSGCGKTTLLRMVNRMVDPTTGSVWIDDDNVADIPPVPLRRRIGYVMQNAGLLPHRKVIDNIATVPLLNGVSKTDAHRRALELMELVGLETTMANRYPDQLSGGQQQRVGVARGLAADPNILLMDEPFGAVDPLVRADLQTELLRIQRELHKTIVFVTHDIAEALALGDQIVILAKGARIAQAGTAQQVVAEPADEFVADFLGLGRGTLDLHLRETPGGTLVVDGHGRPAGRLADPSPRAEH